MKMKNCIYIYEINNYKISYNNKYIFLIKKIKKKKKKKKTKKKNKKKKIHTGIPRCSVIPLPVLPNTPNDKLSSKINLYLYLYFNSIFNIININKNISLFFYLLINIFFK